MLLVAKVGLSLPLFLYFCLFYILQLTDKFLPMLGFIAENEERNDTMLYTDDQVDRDSY